MPRSSVVASSVEGLGANMGEDHKLPKQRVKDMPTEGNRLFHSEHTWIQSDGDEATIGISEYAQNQLGEVLYVELPETTSCLVQGKSFGTVESAKVVSELFAPVSGEVLEVNEALAEQAWLVNKDPHGEGWLVRIKLTKSEELAALMDAERYKDFVQQ